MLSSGPMGRASGAAKATSEDRIGLQRPPSGVTSSVKRPRAAVVAMEEAVADQTEAKTAEAGLPTMRELLPWHQPGATVGGVSDVPPPPAFLPTELPPAPAMASGVRLADEVHAQSANDADDLEGPLSFQVYTLKDLDARRPDADPALRMSRVMFESMPRPPSPWLTARDRGQELAAALFGWSKAWAKTPKQRPSLEPVRVPFELARAAFAAALRTVNWKKVSIYGGASVATMMVLLAVVLTVADLTDDLKPARSVRDPDARSLVASSDLASAARTTAVTTGKAAVGVAAAPAATVVVEAPAQPAAAPSIELDEVDAPAPTPATARSAPAPARPRRAVPSVQPRPRTNPATQKQLSFRDANEVFKP